MYAKDVYKQIEKKEIDTGLVDHAAVADAGIDWRRIELGKQLFNSAACRLNKIDPETALRHYTQGLIDSIEASKV